MTTKRRFFLRTKANTRFQRIARYWHTTWNFVSVNTPPSSLKLCMGNFTECSFVEISLLLWIIQTHFALAKRIGFNYPFGELPCFRYNRFVHSTDSRDYCSSHRHSVSTRGHAGKRHPSTTLCCLILPLSKLLSHSSGKPTKMMENFRLRLIVAVSAIQASCLKLCVATRQNGLKTDDRQEEKLFSKDEGWSQKGNALATHCNSSRKAK